MEGIGRLSKQRSIILEKQYFTTIGQDSHRVSPQKDKPLILGGVEFDADFCLEANSDGDVVLHAITNAVSGATGVNVLGKIADDMCKSGITDSAKYLAEALKYMNNNTKIIHISISIEAARPKFAPKITEMRKKISELLNLNPMCVGITATTGEKLTEFGRGNGIFVTVLLSCCREI